MYANSMTHSPNLN